MKASGNKRIAKNSVMLLLMNAAKMLFPLLTLPYLTRVLSLEGYGVVVYLKSVIAYMQTVVDFGFMLSATKDIVRTDGDREKMGGVVSNVLLGKCLLAAAAFAVLVVLTFAIPILRSNVLFSLLSFLPVFLSIFLLDFLFRGIEKMEVITMRFVIMRGIATVLTFVFIHSDQDLIKIPLLDSLGSLVAVVLVWVQYKKLKIPFAMPNWRKAWDKLKESAVYFVSNMASTSFSALNTLLLGIALTATDLAYWGVCVQIISAIQAVYTPITDSIYPVMIQEKKLSLIKKVQKIFMPIIAIGCVLTYFLAEWGVVLVGGEKYAGAAMAMRLLIPVLFFSFPAMLMGWPTLGAIDKNAETSKTTVYTVIFQLAGLAVLWVSGYISLAAVAILRSITELLLWALRLRYCMRFRKEFADER